MKEFKHVEDIDAYFEPMDYQGFWYAVAPFDLSLQPRVHCDSQIARGEVEPETILTGLKYLARLELTEKLGLVRRPSTPWVQLVEQH